MVKPYIETLNRKIRYNLNAAENWVKQCEKSISANEPFLYYDIESKNDNDICLELSIAELQLVKVAIKCILNTEVAQRYYKSIAIIDNIVWSNDLKKAERLKAIDSVISKKGKTFSITERKILKLIEKNMPLKDIQFRLQITQKTFDNHCLNIANKIVDFSNENNKDRYKITNSNNAQKPIQTIRDFLFYSGKDIDSLVFYKQEYYNKFLLQNKSDEYFTAEENKQLIDLIRNYKRENV